MISRRPANKPSRPALPLGPSSSYFFSTAIHGIRLRSAASASRARVEAFSFTSSCSRAAAHSCGDTINGVFIAIGLFRLFSDDVCMVDLLFAEILLVRGDKFRSSDRQATRVNQGLARPGIDPLRASPT